MTWRASEDFSSKPKSSHRWRWGVFNFWFLLGLLNFLTVNAWSGTISLNQVWQKNLSEHNLRAPFVGAVAENGTICIAMKQSQEAVILTPKGQIQAVLRGDSRNASNLASIANIGYEPSQDVFWIWSDAVRRISRWNLEGKHLGTTTVAAGLERPMIHRSRKIYLRRPDQGSRFALFSYFPEEDHEVMVWQPAVEAPGVQKSRYVSFALGLHYLVVRDRHQLTWINLDVWEDDFSLDLPKKWFPETPKGVGDSHVRITTGDHKVYTPIMADSRDHFWVFREAKTGLGCLFAMYSSREGVQLASGILEDIPLMVDREHLYFIDIENAYSQKLRKVQYWIVN